MQCSAVREPHLLESQSRVIDLQTFPHTDCVLGKVKNAASVHCIATVSVTYPETFFHMAVGTVLGVNVTRCQDMRLKKYYTILP